ncbi:hypothetical protein ABZU32_35070 [Sphaerisporangium sp. NPDC005288]
METGSPAEPALLRHAPLYYRLLVAMIGLVPSWKNAGWVLRYRF